MKNQKLARAIQTGKAEPKEMRGYRLEADLIAAIRRAARSMKVTETTIVRAALRAHLDSFIVRGRR